MRLIRTHCLLTIATTIYVIICPYLNETQGIFQFNVIRYKRKKDAIRKAKSLHFQTHYAYLYESECIAPILYFKRLLIKTSNYESSICNVV